MAVAVALLCVGSQLAALPQVMSAQSVSGLTIQGTVFSAVGHPLPGAFVTVGDASAKTDSAGKYIIETQSAALVLMKAWAAGFTAQTIKVRSTTGGFLRGTVSVDFDNGLALHSAFTNPAFGAILAGLPVSTKRSVHWVHIRVLVNVPLQSKIMVTLPSGRVRSYALRKSGQAFTATLSFHAAGVYDVEVNTTTGIPVFNVATFHGVQPAPPAVPNFPPDPPNGSPQQLAVFALLLINHARQVSGNAPLIMQPRMAQSAEQHDADIIRSGSLGSHPHIGSDGSTPYQRIQGLGLRTHSVGEDVGEAYTIGEIVDGFLSGPSHRAVILGKYQWVGIGIATDGPDVLMTVDLAS